MSRKATPFRTELSLNGGYIFLMEKFFAILIDIGNVGKSMDY